MRNSPVPSRASDAPGRGDSWARPPLTPSPRYTSLISSRTRLGGSNLVFLGFLNENNQRKRDKALFGGFGRENQRESHHGNYAGGWIFTYVVQNVEPNETGRGLTKQEGQELSRWKHVPPSSQETVAQGACLVAGLWPNGDMRKDSAWASARLTPRTTSSWWQRWIAGTRGEKWKTKEAFLEAESGQSAIVER